MQEEKGSSGYTYGSVNTDEESPEDKSFDEANLYYYKEEERTKKEKLSMLVKTLVPIVIAFVLVGVLGSVLFHNFGNLYPGPGTPPSRASYPTSTSSENSSTVIEDTSPVPKLKPTSSSNSSSKTSGGSSCAANPKCLSLGLTGQCCPTSEGVLLGCCS